MHSAHESTYVSCAVPVVGERAGNSRKQYQMANGQILGDYCRKYGLLRDVGCG